MTAHKKKHNSSTPVRIDKDVYAKLVEHKDSYKKLHKLSEVTFSHFMSELLNVADLLMLGKEAYGVGKKMFDDPAEAWGYAVTEHVRTGVSIQPIIYVRVGTDNRFSLGAQ